MSLRKIWLDCDPGHDDMLAIVMAALSEELDLIGVSTSAGNSTIENTTQNALDILHEIGKDHIQVVKGSLGPLCRKLKTAAEYHGLTGLQGAKLERSNQRAVEVRPFLHIYNEIMRQEDKVELVVTGAMTNVAVLLGAFPDIRGNLSGITIMGGAIGLGNVTPSAEFNIFTDPEAAAIVMASGMELTLVPLEVTHTVEVSERVFEQLAKLQSSFGKKLTPLFRHFQVRYKENQNFDYPLAHDPCTIYYLLHPHDFKTRKVFVEIELQGSSRGRTNCHFYHRGSNATICEKIDVQNFWQLMIDCLKKLE